MAISHLDASRIIVHDLFSQGKSEPMPGPRKHTNGELLHFSLYFQLGRLKIRHHKDLRNEEMRKQICDAVINDLRPFNPWLDEQAVEKFPVAVGRS